MVRTDRYLFIVSSTRELRAKLCHASIKTRVLGNSSYCHINQDPSMVIPYFVCYVSVHLLNFSCIARRSLYCLSEENLLF